VNAEDRALIRALDKKIDETREMVSHAFADDGRLARMERQLAMLNGTVKATDERSRKNTEKIDDKPCGEHTTDLTLLKHELGRYGTNWSRWAGVALGVLQALVTAGLLFYLTKVLEALSQIP
jgi:hypothetical protein